ncbi:MAG TPA: sigma-54 dependent transcriptional regulator, partial [Pyrinomonadaceae bacterium]|nr:sigma-54 dependent transcriptional regulator [Pyrinomonadaceae bacterium]
RCNRPFVDINCSAIPATLIEAELFGHQRGSFTGADETRPGLFEEASSGTLFLDEVDALDLSSQAKLLRVLQERQIRRVGGRKNIPVDVRIISATNKNLHESIVRGTFRHDLLYRLCVVPLHVPELHERSEDVPLLIQYFLEQHAVRRGTPPKSVSDEAMKVLLGYRWRGNVRELENTLEYALAVGIHEEVRTEDLPPIVRSGQPSHDATPLLQELLDSNAPLSEIERRYVLLMLERHDGHQINTAAALGIDRRTLSRKLQQYGSRILNKEEHW